MPSQSRVPITFVHDKQSGSSSSSSRSSGSTLLSKSAVFPSSFFPPTSSKPPTNSPNAFLSSSLPSSTHHLTAASFGLTGRLHPNHRSLFPSSSSSSSSSSAKSSTSLLYFNDAASDSSGSGASTSSSNDGMSPTSSYHPYHRRSSSSTIRRAGAPATAAGPGGAASPPLLAPLPPGLVRSSSAASSNSLLGGVPNMNRILLSCLNLDGPSSSPHGSPSSSFSAITNGTSSGNHHSHLANRSSSVHLSPIPPPSALENDRFVDPASHPPFVPPPAPKLFPSTPPIAIRTGANGKPLPSSRAAVAAAAAEAAAAKEREKRPHPYRRTSVPSASLAVPKTRSASGGGASRRGGSASASSTPASTSAALPSTKGALAGMLPGLMSTSSAARPPAPKRSRKAFTTAGLVRAHHRTETASVPTTSSSGSSRTSSGSSSQLGRTGETQKGALLDVNSTASARTSHQFSPPSDTLSSAPSLSIATTTASSISNPLSHTSFTHQAQASSSPSNISTLNPAVPLRVPPSSSSTSASTASNNAAHSVSKTQLPLSEPQQHKYHHDQSALNSSSLHIPSSTLSSSRPGNTSTPRPFSSTTTAASKSQASLFSSHPSSSVGGSAAVVVGGGSPITLHTAPASIQQQQQQVTAATVSTA